MISSGLGPSKAQTSDSMERLNILNMKTTDIEECNRLIQETREKQARLEQLKELKVSKRKEQFESVYSLKTTLQRGFNVQNEVASCFADIEKVIESENDLKMFLCSSEQAKLDVKSGDGSMLVAAGTTQKSSQNLVKGLKDINSSVVGPDSVNSALDFVSNLTERSDRTYLAAVTCATRGGLVRPEFA